MLIIVHTSPMRETANKATHSKCAICNITSYFGTKYAVWHSVNFLISCSVNMTARCQSFFHKLNGKFTIEHRYIFIFVYTAKMLYVMIADKYIL